MEGKGLNYLILCSLLVLPFVLKFKRDYLTRCETLVVPHGPFIINKLQEKNKWGVHSFKNTLIFYKFS